MTDLQKTEKSDKNGTSCFCEKEQPWADGWKEDLKPFTRLLTQ